MSRSESGRTIAAVASPPGPGLRGVIRVSGPSAAELVRSCWRSTENIDPTRARGTSNGRFDDGIGEQPLLLIWMPGPHSYTREDVAEFHLPGSAPLLSAALRRLIELGARPAGPGEFTRRAFENGRLDLSQAEGVLELVAAQSEAEIRAGAALLMGGLGQRVESLRRGLDDLRALCEASLDFDQEDTGHVPRAELELLFELVGEGFQEALGWEQRRDRDRGLLRAVLLGAPNAGKSSLFNRLCEQRALVADHAGTTRDGAAATWRLPSVDVELLDSPGLDANASGVDAYAQDLARRERAGARFALWVVDSSCTSPSAAQAEGRIEPGLPCVVVWNKIDLPGAPREPGRAWLEAARKVRELAPAWVPVSAKTGAGMELLEQRASEVLISDSAGLSLGRELSARHHAALERAAEALERARAGLSAQIALDLVAEDLRSAGVQLDELSGETTAEDLLDRIFARFCLGK